MKIKNLFFLTFFLLIFSVYMSIIFQVGFISDDFTLLMRSENFTFNPLESHHYSLLINALFFSVNKNLIGPPFFHLLGLLFHGLNTCLFYLFLHKTLKNEKPASFLFSCLFAVNPAGIEALVWCCALPYIFTTTILLSSILLFDEFLKKEKFSKLIVISLCFLQGFAFLIWDWAILIVPILFIFAWFKDSLTYRPSALISCGLIWSTIIITKKIFGVSLGYTVNSLYQISGIVLTSPFLTLFPFASKEFYISLPGIFCSLFVFFCYLFFSFLNKQAKFLFILFILTLMPQAILGYPQSRYYYLSSFFLYAIFPLLFNKNLFKTFAYCTTGFCLVISIFFTFDKINQWKEASLIVSNTRKSIENIISNHPDTQIAIKGLPDSMEIRNQIWKPYLWRCGIEIFKNKIITITNPNIPIYLMHGRSQNYHLEKIDGE